LYALRQVVGERTFSEIERSWVERYKDESVSAEDWIAHVNRVSHRNLTGFLRAWLYGDTVPPMPGHADWTADPVTATAAAARSAAAPSARDLELGIYNR
jgi:aminopeptidase N